MPQIKTEITEKEFNDFYSYISTGKDVPANMRKSGIFLLEAFKECRARIFEQGMNIKKLRRLFSPITEKTRNILKEKKNIASENEQQKSTEAVEEAQKNPSAEVPKKGHGKRPVSDFKTARRIKHVHSDLKSGGICPDGCGGKVYDLDDRIFVRIIGRSPIEAEIHERQTLRCSKCGKLFVADISEDTSYERVDASASAFIAFMRYCGGLPFYRQERLFEMFGVPLSDSELAEIAEKVADSSYPVHEFLQKMAAQSNLFHYDDTRVCILSVKKENKTKRTDERIGTGTTAIICKNEDRNIFLFFTGRNHAGENFSALMQHRKPGLAPPKVMADAAAKNFSYEIPIIRHNCNVHARRNFVEIAESFPAECTFILEQYAIVFNNEAHCQKTNMNAQERLVYHKKQSAEPMKKMYEAACSITKNETEKNSPLGRAYNYLIKYWEYLTQFLRIEGSPIDNNIAERVLKLAIVQRKNSLLFKTEQGALLSDIVMSLSITAQQNGINPLKYLAALCDHKSYAHAHPEKWLPWNYEETLNSIGKKLIAA